MYVSDILHLLITLTNFIGLKTIHGMHTLYYNSLIVIYSFIVIYRDYTLIN